MSELRRETISPVFVLSKNPISCVTIEPNKTLLILLVNLAAIKLNSPPRKPAEIAVPSDIRVIMRIAFINLVLSLSMAMASMTCPV